MSIIKNGKRCKEGELTNPRRLHEVVHLMISGKVEYIAAILDVSPSLVYKWGQPPAPEGEGCPISGKHIKGLCEATGNNSLIEYLAECLGMVALPLPTDVGGCDVKRLIEIMNSCATMLKTVSEAEADGRITREECQKIAASIQDLIVKSYACKLHYQGRFANGGAR